MLLDREAHKTGGWLPLKDRKRLSEDNQADGIHLRSEGHVVISVVLRD